ncbi:MAG: hypothetical protein OEL87_02160 [Nanoarchaeota archaeon]|nr:hypothetical protein [Nanoarchaeota archaeon]
MAGLKDKLTRGQDVKVSLDGEDKNFRVIDTDIGRNSITILGDVDRFANNPNPMDSAVHVVYLDDRSKLDTDETIAPYDGKYKIGSFPTGHKRYDEVKTIMEGGN